MWGRGGSRGASVALGQDLGASSKNMSCGSRASPARAREDVIMCLHLQYM